MRKISKLLIMLSVIIIAILSMTLLVACDLNSEGSGGGDDLPGGDVTLIITPELNGGAKYNGESGVDGDVYISSLLAMLKVDKGEAKAIFSIKEVSIQLSGGEFAIATAAELAKFTLLDTAVDKITTESVNKTFRVQFGDFSDTKYWGAEFKITLEGALTAL